MIDFIKLYWTDKSLLEPFVCNEANFSSLIKSIDWHTSEICYPYRTELKNMKVSVCEKTGNVQNSLHMLHNVLERKGNQNHNDFTYSLLCETIEYINQKLPDINNAKITQLEFGLNIQTDIPAEYIIQRNVLMHKYKGYNHNKQYFGNGELKQFDHTNYAIKIYDKAKQFDLDQNILRLELKFRNSKDFHDLGIFKVNDLKDKAKLTELFKLLLQRFEELTIIDELDSSIELSHEDLQRFSLYRNSNYWTEDLRNTPRQIKSRKKKDFLKMFKEESKLIKEFIDENKLSTKKEVELKRIFTYYGSL